MAIRKLPECIFYNNSQKAFINHLSPIEAYMWEGKLKGKKRGSRKNRDELKSFIRQSLKDNHGLYCAFCGLKLFITSSDYIDHIAPKGIYPIFMFESMNLALTCSLCNGFYKKREIDTIRTFSNTYSSCEFNIVHPYFDDPDDHFEYKEIKGIQALIELKTDKAKNSNDIFNLDSIEMTEERIKVGLLENNPLTDEDKTLFDQVVAINRSI